MQNAKLNNVYYLEDHDFDGSGKFLQKGSWIIFIYGDFCPHCHHVKPVIQELINENRNKNWAVIQLDGARASEQLLGRRISSIIKNYRGVPTIVQFKDGKLKKEYSGDRSKKSLQSFVKSV